MDELCGNVLRKKNFGVKKLSIKKMCKLFVLVAFVLLSISCEISEAVQVSVKQGTLEGIVSTSRNGTEYYSFYGIPFAKPPVGELRFEVSL